MRWSRSPASIGDTPASRSNRPSPRVRYQSWFGFTVYADGPAPRGGAGRHLPIAGSDEPRHRLHPLISTSSPKQRPSPSRPDWGSSTLGHDRAAGRPRCAQSGWPHPRPSWAEGEDGPPKLGCTHILEGRRGLPNWSRHAMTEPRQSRSTFPDEPAGALLHRAGLAGPAICCSCPGKRPQASPEMAALWARGDFERATGPDLRPISRRCWQPAWQRSVQVWSKVTIYLTDMANFPRIVPRRDGAGSPRLIRPTPPLEVAQPWYCPNHGRKSM